MIRPALLLVSILCLTACNYNPRPGGWKLMLQKQPQELPPRYYIPRLDPDISTGAVLHEDRGRRIIHDSTFGPVPAPGRAH
jgi:hypothetical protein